LINTDELQLSGLIGTVDMQKIRIMDFSLKVGYIDGLKCGKKILQTVVLGYIFIYVQIKHYYIIPCMYLTNGEKFKP